MTNVFVSLADKRYDMTQTIGVFDNLDEALQRCRDRPFADEEQTMQYDLHWVEEWELGGSFLRQYNMAGFVDVESADG